MRYVSADCETTGLDAQVHSLVSACLIADDLAEPGVPVSELPRLACYLRLPQDVVWSRRALEMHGHELAVRLPDPSVSELGGVPVVTAHDFSLRVKNWFHAMRWKPEKSSGLIRPTFAGKNVGFDLKFLAGILGSAAVKPRHRSIDPTVWFLRVGDAELPDLAGCKERAGLSGGVAHTAWADCEDVVRLVRAGHGRFAGG